MQMGTAMPKSETKTGKPKTKTGSLQSEMQMQIETVAPQSESKTGSSKRKQAAYLSTIRNKNTTGKCDTKIRNKNCNHKSGTGVDFACLFVNPLDYVFNDVC